MLKQSYVYTQYDFFKLAYCIYAAGMIISNFFFIKFNKNRGAGAPLPQLVFLFRFLIRFLTRFLIAIYN